MPNPMSLVSSLAQEVADILGIDNLDARLYEWLGFIFNDVCQRVPDPLFYTSSVDTIVSGSSSSTLGESIGTPVALMIVNASGDLYIPVYRPPAEFDRLVNIGSTIAGGVQPLIWTVVPQGTTQKIRISPPASGDMILTLVWSGNYYATPPTADDRIPLPYHFEGVLVWGAAWFASMSIAPDRAMICEGEYEVALQDMVKILALHSDSVPQMRQIEGPFAGFQPELPRIPGTLGA
jgi:hypothetical protein